MKIIGKIKSSIKAIKYKSLLVLELARNKKKYIYAESFYPEKVRKTTKQIWIDQIRHIFTYSQINKQYFEYGIDIKGVNDDDFLDVSSYITRRNKANNPTPFNYLCLVRDKKLFAIYGKYHGFPVWDSIGVLKNGKIINDKEECLDIRTIIEERQKIFIKPIDGGGGKGTYRIDCIDGVYQLNFKEIEITTLCEEINEISNKGCFLVQDIFQQHNALSQLYNKSVNTLRVVTVNPKQTEDISDIILVACILRIGANGLVVDNHGLGGLEIAVDSTGKLEKYAYYKPGFGTKVTEHPDSHIVFEGYEIPYYNDAIQLCMKFHSKLAHIPHIGWDIAFGDDGVILFEANDCSGTKLQTFLGPLRNEYKTWLPY